MDAKPQTQHQWLDKFVGEWISECECQMGPDQPPSKTQGTEIVRSIGGLWIMAEGQMKCPDGDNATSIMTLGYDPQSQRYVGTFIASMMTHLWLYNGSLDAAGKVLTLDSEGPNFNQSAMAKYQDIIEFVNDDHRIMTSQLLGDDGTWHQFMTAHYRRQK
jgi:Protein of unknown function (DUF1579)